jgi:hypothetical protein
MLFEETIEVKQTPKAAFAFATDLTNLCKWDPAIVDAVQVTPGPVRQDTRFRVIMDFAGFELGFDYTVTEYKPWARAVLTGAAQLATAVDVITVKRTLTGTRLTWRVLIRLRGRLACADPLLRALLLPRVKGTIEGLREQLGPAGNGHPRDRRRRGALQPIATGT